MDLEMEGQEALVVGEQDQVEDHQLDPQFNLLNQETQVHTDLGMQEDLMLLEMVLVVVEELEQEEVVELVVPVVLVVLEKLILSQMVQLQFITLVVVEDRAIQQQCQLV
tara:strand:- start:37 stop:363 length:327 start_codon:yes stop_codon:yes gene_type:complete